MRYLAFAFFTVSLLLFGLQGVQARTGQDAWAQESSSVAIQAPEAGQALQGKVAILGRTAVEGFAGYELAFAYFENPTTTWFLIHQGEEPVTGGLLAEWDTTTISDGVYILGLTVTLEDGSQLSAEVPGVRVRNYTAIETDTPTPETPTASPNPSNTPAATFTLTLAPTLTPIPVTPSPPPPNRAQLSASQVVEGIVKGALGALVIFAVFGIYLGLRAFIRRI